MTKYVDDTPLDTWFDLGCTPDMTVIRYQLDIFLDVISQAVD